MRKVEHRQRPREDLRQRVDQHDIAFGLKVALPVRLQLIEVSLREPVLVRAVGLSAIDQLPRGVENEALAGRVADQQVRLQAEPVIALMLNQVVQPSLRLEHQRLLQLPRQMLCHEGLEQRLHRKQQRRRIVGAGTCERRFLVKDQPCPGNGIRIVTHASVEANSLQVLSNLRRRRDIGKHKDQLSSQALVQL